MSHRSIIFTFLLLLTMLFSNAPLALAETSAPNAVSINIQNTTTAPERFIVPVNIAGVTVGVESFRLEININPALTIVDVLKTGTLMENGLVDYVVDPITNKLTVSGAIGSPITTDGLLINLQLEILSITADVNYTLSGTSRVNENVISSSVGSGTVTVQMVDLTGQVESWTGQPVAGSDVSLTNGVVAAQTANATEATVTTQTDSNGLYAFSLGYVDAQTLAFAWNEAILFDNVVTEFDAAKALQTSLGLFNCPDPAGDITGSAGVTEQDAAELLQYSLGQNNFTPAVSFLPNNVNYPIFNADTLEDSTAYLLGDCSDNNTWVAGVTGGSIDLTMPTITAEGAVVTFAFEDAIATKFILEGLPEKAKLELTLLDKDGKPGKGLVATENNIVVAATARPGFQLQVKVSVPEPAPLMIKLKGRVDERPYLDWLPIDVAPAQSFEFIFLPVVNG